MYHLNILIDICWNFSDLLQGTRTMHPIVSWTIGSQSSQTVMPVKMDMSKYCLQCHKCVYLGKQREKWPTWCQAWPFYGKPQQPPCAQHLYFRFSYLFTLKHHDYNSGFVAVASGWGLCLPQWVPCSPVPDSLWSSLHSSGELCASSEHVCQKPPPSHTALPLWQ